MMTEGIIVFNQEEFEWRLWVGHQDYWLQQGYLFNLFIRDMYFEAFLEKDHNWFVTLEGKAKFVLHCDEVYRVSVELNHFMKVEDPL